MKPEHQKKLSELAKALEGALVEAVGIRSDCADRITVRADGFFGIRSPFENKYPYGLANLRTPEKVTCETVLRPPVDCRDVLSDAVFLRRMIETARHPSAKNNPLSAKAAARFHETADAIFWYALAFRNALAELRAEAEAEAKAKAAASAECKEENSPGFPPERRASRFKAGSDGAPAGKNGERASLMLLLERCSLEQKIRHIETVGCWPLDPETGEKDRMRAERFERLRRPGPVLRLRCDYPRLHAEGSEYNAVQTVYTELPWLYDRLFALFRELRLRPEAAALAKMPEPDWFPPLPPSCLDWCFERIPELEGAVNRMEAEIVAVLSLFKACAAGTPSATAARWEKELDRVLEGCGWVLSVIETYLAKAFADKHAFEAALGMRLPETYENFNSLPCLSTEDKKAALARWRENRAGSDGNEKRPDAWLEARLAAFESCRKEFQDFRARREASAPQGGSLPDAVRFFANSSEQP